MNDLINYIFCKSNASIIQFFSINHFLLCAGYKPELAFHFRTSTSFKYCEWRFGVHPNLIEIQSLKLYSCAYIFSLNMRLHIDAKTSNVQRSRYICCDFTAFLNWCFLPECRPRIILFQDNQNKPFKLLKSASGNTISIRRIQRVKIGYNWHVDKIFIFPIVGRAQSDLCE